jgi:protein-tyrosine phosphatase
LQVTLPDGAVVYARGRLDLVPAELPRAPDFAVYLDERWRGDSDVMWPHVIVDWPDFGVPADEPAAFAAIADLHRQARAGELVELACYGGIGRTGTVLSCLTVVAGLPTADDAVAWVREHYHPSAVETSEQHQMIDRFANTRPARS